MGRIAIAVVLMAAATAPLMTPLQARPQADDVRKTVDGTIQVQKETQQQQDQWEKEKTELVARYRAAKANVEYLRDRKALEGKRSQALDDAIAELERRLDESGRLQASLQDSLTAIVGRLEGWVEVDLPFLLEERRQRLAALREELVKPDVTGAEKLRRVLEALQVETGYGSSMDVAQQRIEVGGETLFVDVFRLGRISVFWRTPDGKRVGEYNRAAGEWVELPGKYKRSIGEAMDMAARVKPVELIALPLGRIQP
jgi:hypothetical protein